MKSRWAALILGALMAAAVACSSGDKPTGVEGEATGNAAVREERNGDEKARASAQVTRPLLGSYTYELRGRGSTSVPEGSELTETVSSSGDLYTSVVSNNQNLNTRKISTRWESRKLLQLSTESNINGRKTVCNFEPPIALLHIPIRVEKFPTQRWASNDCSGKIDIEVIGQEEVTDVKGRKWVTWRIETRNVSGGATVTETRWFSPKLGKDIRILAVSASSGIRNQTETLLRSYPS